MSKYATMFASMGYLLPIISWHLDEPYTMNVFTDQMDKADMWGLSYFDYYKPFHN